MEYFSSPDTRVHFENLYKDGRIRYGDLKKQLAEDIIRFTTPFRERILELAANDDYLKKVSAMGAEKARISASRTIREIREIIGFRKF